MKHLLTAFTFILISGVYANIPHQGFLATDIQLPLCVDGKTLGSLSLKAGSEITIVKIESDGVLITRGESTPVKVAREAITSDSLEVAEASPTPEITPTIKPTSSENSSSVSKNNISECLNGKTTNTFPCPAISADQACPVMYVKDYCKYRSVSSINYKSAIRFVNYNGENYMICCSSDTVNTNKYSVSWTLLQRNDDGYLTTTKSTEKLVLDNNDSIAIRNSVFLGGYKPGLPCTEDQRPTYRLLERLFGKFQKDEKWCLLFPAQKCYYNYKSTAFNTLALVPEKELSEWLHYQHIKCINNGKFDIKPLSANTVYNGTLKKFTFPTQQ